MNFNRVRWNRWLATHNKVSKTAQQYIGVGFSLLALCLTASCSNRIHVKSDFPAPVIAQLPIDATGIYSDELSNFSYKETEKNRSKWRIKAGDAHVTLFDTIFSRLFSQFHSQVGTWPPSEALPAQDSTSPAPVQGKQNIGLYIIPSIKDFQYSSPKETRLNVYEVWFKYNIKVFDKNQSLIADWIMSSYGKTPTALLKSKEKAMEQALVMSLRDLGASLSLGFQRVPEIRDWLASAPTADLQARPQATP